jgi:putative zinc finger/helix-turn-helix YgiT family protein
MLDPNHQSQADRSDESAKGEVNSGSMAKPTAPDASGLVRAALQYAAGLGKLAAGEDQPGESDESTALTAATSCPSCHHDDIETRMEAQRFEYGEGRAAVTLTAMVPVRRCRHCGFDFLDAVAERSRHDAVCQYLGRLTPTEIRAGRRRLGMNRRRFALLTGIGEASLGRWESGAQIQNAAMDRLIRLALYPENVERLLRAGEYELAPPRRFIVAEPRALTNVQQRRSEGMSFKTLAPPLGETRAA